MDLIRKLLVTNILLLIIVMGVNAQAETYHIIHIKGTMKLQESGESLNTGDKINADDAIVFGSDEDLAAVISSKQGRKILKPVKSDKKSGDELSYFVKENLLPVRKHTTTRSVRIFSSLDDLKYFFTLNNFLLLAENKFRVNSYIFPLSEEQFFYLRYKHNGEDVNKRLSSEKQDFIIDRAELFKVDDIVINPEDVSDYRLFYYNQTKDTSVQVADLKLLIPELDDLKKELEIVTEVSKSSGLKEGDIKREIDAYLKETYGQYDAHGLSLLLKK
ncbi:MAG: hypothetical protein AAFX87_29960 [Bacteroidota bacterium]